MTAYVGSGPYCYANSLAMMMGHDAPSPAVIEFATGSAFGMQLVGGTLPFFDPYGWTPDVGVDEALAAAGWTSTTDSGGGAADALSRLRAHLATAPVFIGPVEMGHLRHQPGMTGPIGADHFLVALEVTDDYVLVHDPQGYPYATVPMDAFMAAWRAETVEYGVPFTMRTDFRRVREVAEPEIIEAVVAAGVDWLSMSTAHDMPPGSCGNADAAERLSELIAAGCPDELRDHLVHFAVRVGARRADDAATVLSRGGHGGAARVLRSQARLIGALQHPLVVGDDRTASAVLRSLASTYDELRAAMTSRRR